MDAVMLARLQFGTTIIYHFFFVPLTMGLVLLVAIMETLYVRSGNVAYKRMAQFWGKLFMINFAMGVVTGIVQEFQFGMNWSTYSRFIGDVFGAPLAIEALLAFFMESTFLGLWHFGWESLPKKLHLATIWMVALGSHLSAFWIMIANAFMQEPVGYIIRNGRAEMTDFFALITNSALWVQFPHVVAGGVVTGSFFVIGISAYHIVRKTDTQGLFRRSLTIGMTAALIGSVAVILAGHQQAQHTIAQQPMKMAAAEALWNSENPASLSIVSIINEPGKENLFAIRVPYALSFLAYDSLQGEVQGINQLQAEYVKQYGPGNYIPPVVVLFWGFRFMVGAGLLMALLALMGLFFIWKKRLDQQRWFLRLLIASIAIPYIANTCGWIMTEMGRQPWLVSGLLKTVDGISPSVSPTMILLTLIGFLFLYGVLAVVDGTLLFKFARQGFSPVLESADKKDESLVVTY